MNCETCGLKFKRLKDVMRHVTSATHSCVNFFCIPCALSLPRVADVIEHVASKEHSITALATGVRLDENDFMPASFPAHNCCLLCSSRDGTLDNAHLKSDSHRYMAWLLRTMIASKKIFCNNRKACPMTQGFISKMINAKHNTRLDDELIFNKLQGPLSYTCELDDERISHKLRGSLRYTCELCSLHFVDRKYLDQHLTDGSHKRVEEFLSKISLIADELAVIGIGYTYVTKTFSNSLRSLYYCEVCSMWIDTIFNYMQHRKSPRHKRTEAVWKKSNKKKMCSMGASTLAAHYYPKLEYDRYGIRLASGGPKVGRKNENIVSDCCGEKASKKLKTSASNRECYCESKRSKHKEDISKFVKNKEEKLHCNTHGTIYKTSSLNFELGEAKSHCRKHAPSRNSLQLCFGTSKDAPGLDLEDGEYLSDSHFEDTHADVDYDKEHYCELCDFLCYNSLHYGKHLMGNQHKRMRRLINRKDKVNSDVQDCETSGDSHPLQYNCELCDVFNNDSQSYEFHLNSAVHKKNKWMLYVLNQRPI